MVAVAALIATSTLATLATDLYAPIQPHVADILKASPEMVKLTVSLYFLAGSALYLLYGPLSERFGRRPILIAAIAIFALTSFMSAFVTTVEQLIVMRVLQGAAGGAETMLVLAIIRDYFADREQVRAMSIYRAAVGFTPIFSPLVGVMLFEAYGWQASFLAVAGLSTIVVVALGLFLKESNQNRLKRLDFAQIGREYLLILTNLRFLLLSMVFVASVGFFIIFHSAVPFVVGNELGLPSRMFAYLQAGFMIAFIIGNLAASQLMKIMSVEKLLWLCMGVAAIANAVYWIAIASGELTLFSIGLPILLLAFCNGPIMSAVPTLAMASTRASAGASSAMLLTIVSVLASGAAVVEGRLQTALDVNSSVSIAMTLSGLLLIGTLCAAGALRRNSNSNDSRLSDGEQVGSGAGG
jgi:DHA1 family bicyclomycin/chloramphenicol resistance-like MFS transporter